MLSSLRCRTLLRRPVLASAVRSVLTDETKAVVRASAPAMVQNSDAMIRFMFGCVFQKYPEARRIFNLNGQYVPQAKPSILACAVQQFATNIDDVGKMGPAVERMCQKHVALNVFPEHYKQVGGCLNLAATTVLREGATPELLKAWGAAYTELADMLIQREAQIRKEKREMVGGWEGWRDFVVRAKVKESSTYTSFELVPKDGGALPTHVPGEYVALLASVPGKELTQRIYTISNAPNSGFFRLTVKREDGEHPGQVSTWLHNVINKGDVLKLSVPCGDFLLTNSIIKSGAPICFISGSTGLTPVRSMVETLLELNVPQPIIYLDQIKTESEAEGLSQRLLKVSKRHPNFKAKFFYDTPSSANQIQGPITIDHIKAHVPIKDARFFISGPRLMLGNLLPAIFAAGVPQQNVLYEFFG